MQTPVDELWIASRTFGSKLRETLRMDPRLKRTEILLLGEFIENLPSPPRSLAARSADVRAGGERGERQTVSFSLPTIR